MDAPRVSVLIGCWNNADTLHRAIDSILSQTVDDLELIVVDDGSTDRTSEVVMKVSDPRLRYLPLGHIGISGSLNRGLREARGPIVAVQDADDWSLPQRLERELAILDGRPDVAVVGCRMREVGRGDGVRCGRGESGADALQPHSQLLCGVQARRSARGRGL